MMRGRLKDALKEFNRSKSVKANSIPPLSPFIKGGIPPLACKPLFGKEGKGRFSSEVGSNYAANFWVTGLRRITTIGTATLLLVGLSVSCDRLPGKPDEAARRKRQ